MRRAGSTPLLGGHRVSPRRIPRVFLHFVFDLLGWCAIATSMEDRGDCIDSHFADERNLQRNANTVRSGVCLCCRSNRVSCRAGILGKRHQSPGRQNNCVIHRPRSCVLNCHKFNFSPTWRTRRITVVRKGRERLVVTRPHFTRAVSVRPSAAVSRSPSSSTLPLALLTKQGSRWR